MAATINSRWADLRTRTLSALLLVALVAFALWYHRDSFTMLLLIGGTILAREWQGLNINKTLGFRLLGYAYITCGVFSLFWLRGFGLAWVVLAMAAVAATDIGAYFTGKTMGGPKLCPGISPNKTISGSVGGVVCALLLGLLSVHASALPAPVHYAFFALASVACQLGDLLESHLKRRAGVKDAGTILPGHGGLFDRVDGLLAAAPTVALLLWASGPAGAPW